MSRTIDDWLIHARDAETIADAERCLDAAEAQADACHDWRAILAGMAALESIPAERLARTANRTLAAAIAEHAVWGFRDVASLRAKRFGDEAGARAALEAGVDTLLRPRSGVLGQTAALFGRQALAHGYEWVILGQGFVGVLSDEAGRRRCLENGLATARAQRHAGDLCDVAKEWAQCVDRARGVELLREAEAMGGDDAPSPWALANVWHSLDDAASARRVLDAALAGATSCRAALHVLAAWASHEDADGVRRALARAQELAADAGDWLAVGESAYDAGLGPETIRRVVQQAESLAADEASRGRVSSAYKSWLADDAAAARVGPRGVAPEFLRQRVRALEGWETSASALLDWLRARVTPEILEGIAHADYGMDADKHLAVLRDICATGVVPRRLDWVPHEVLALSRWAEGERVDHLARAFCCVLLCLAPSDMDELVTNGVILAESCMALGPEASRLAERFFAWRGETEESGAHADDDSPERPVALLLLFLLHAAATPDDPRLATLARELSARGSGALKALGEAVAESMRAELWSALIARVLRPLEATHPPVASVLAGLGLPRD